MIPNSDDELTLDAVFGGDLPLQQPKRGYRFNVDAVILARFVAETVVPAEHVVDLGAGSGIVGLALAKLWSQSRVALVELQASLADIASANIVRNQLGARVRVHQADLRHSATWRLFPQPQLVVSNPPFYAKGSGRLNPVEQAAIARHELQCALAELVDRVGKELQPGARLALIHLAERKQEVLEAFWASGFEIDILRGVLPGQAAPPTRILVVAKRVATTPRRELPSMPAPLVVHQAPGIYGEEMARYLGAL